LDSSLGKNGLPHRGRRQIYIIIVQSILILWLGAWAVGDYLNNIYVRAYVDGSLAAYGWILILGVVGGSLGSAWTMVRKRRAVVGRSIEKPVKEAKKSSIIPKIATPALQTSPKPGLNPKLASIGIRTSSLSSISSTPSTVPEPSSTGAIPAASFSPPPPSSDSGFKPGPELHPAVAALKAELSERRVTLGLVTATVGQDQSPSSPSPVPVQPQAMQRPSPPGLESRPFQRIEPVNNIPPPTPSFSRPAPGPAPIRPMQSAPPPSRPMQPFSFNRPVQPQFPAQNNSRPILPSRPSQPVSQERFEDAVSRAGFVPTQPSQNPNQIPQNMPRPIPRNVSTVITGIMPKKKDPQDPNNQDSSSGQNSAQ